MDTKTISIKVDERLLKDFKIKVAQSGKSLQEYMFDLINNDINPESPQQRFHTVNNAKILLKKAMRNLDMCEENIVSEAIFDTMGNTVSLSEYEKIIKGCCEHPCLKRIASSMIDYVEEYLRLAIENHNDGVYIIKEKDIPSMTPIDDFYYGIFIGMLEERREIKDINTENGDIEIQLDMEYVSEVNGEDVEQTSSLSFI